MSQEATEQQKGHERVSNQPQVTETGRSPQPPSTGEGDVAQPREDGTESVKGAATPAEPRAPSGAESGALAEANPFEDEGDDVEKLPDVAVATFGEPPPPDFVIIGQDDRQLITQTTVYPWRAHASLVITARDGSRWVGTGWFISPRTLITAGHCVYIRSNVAARVGWATKIEVMPGRNGTAMPFGSVTSTQFHSVRGWTETGSPDFDYGAIVLPTPLGSTVGWFGFGVFNDAELMGAHLNISGYPGDKPGTQWYHSRGTKSVNERRVFYEIDTMGGQSGSAVYRIMNGGRYAVAIHAYGDASANSGTRINSAVFNNLMAWKV